MSRLVRCLVAGLFACAMFLPVARADEVRRYGIFVGQNDGGQGTHRLLYAEEDARKVRDLFTRVGSLEPRNSQLLNGARRDQVLEALERAGAALRRERGAGVRTVLYFYYSGHADREGLKLASSRLGLDELRKVIKASGADLRLLLLDACQSGEATRLKGGTRAPAFLVQVDEGDSLTGEVVITSSAADEASQESDRVGGGYFTHHLVSGLLGAADTTRDGEVTLDEVYAYAYHRTLFETAGSAGGLQHPSFAADLRGHGTLVLSRPDQGQTVLVFPPGLEGHYLVFDRSRKLFVAELFLSGKEERRLALPAGRYLVQKRQTDHLLSAEVVLTRGVMRALDEKDMTRSGFEQDFARGVADANLRRATRSPTTVSAYAGFQTFVAEPPGAVLFPSTPLAGLELEWRDLIGPGWSLAADFSTGATRADISIEGAYTIPADYRELTLGVSLKYGRNLGKLRWSIGPRLSAFYIRRDFPDALQPYQDFASLTPGAVADLGLELFPRFSLGVLGRGQYLYYLVDGEDRSLGYGEALFRLSYTF